MRTRAEVREILLSEDSPDLRIRTFAALLSEESGLGTKGLTVGGGSAIEIYTRGAYLSEDVDILVDNKSRASKVLKSWGFKDEGELWTDPELRLYIDLMEHENTGSRRLTRVVQSEFGSVRLAAIEDLIVKRLLEARYWSQRPALGHAILLAKQYGRDLDWDYVRFFGKKDKIEDLVAEVRKRAGLD